METDRKCGLGWRLTENENKEGDRQIIRIKMETDRK